LSWHRFINSGKQVGSIRSARPMRTIKPCILAAVLSEPLGTPRTFAASSIFIKACTAVTDQKPDSRTLTVPVEAAAAATATPSLVLPAAVTVASFVVLFQ